MKCDISNHVCTWSVISLINLFNEPPLSPRLASLPVQTIRHFVMAFPTMHRRRVSRFDVETIIPAAIDSRVLHSKMAVQDGGPATWLSHDQCLDVTWWVFMSRGLAPPWQWSDINVTLEMAVFAFDWGPRRWEGDVWRWEGFCFGSGGNFWQRSVSGGLLDYFLWS